ncbi:threonine synthase-like 2 [Amphiura filiformis]|uniref:threonine synthase-like 2 n=1 Tax=Amphiura filiformis TaxID=82378 RepID=UPI003B223BC4
MKYTSTQNDKRCDSFEQALFSPGYLTDGGLYMPQTIPQLSKDTLESWSKLSLPDLCKEILSLFIGEDEIPKKDLNNLVDRAYSTFTHKEGVGPIARLSNGLNVLEYFHGRTLAFKDVSLCVVGQLIEYYLEKRKKHVTVVVGTSGDTGSAAIEAVRGLRWVDIVVLLPHGRCTMLQELMMTTVSDNNVHVFSVDGTSDDLDIPVKAVSLDDNFRDQHNLMTLNSINMSRVLVQMVLYFWAYFRGRRSSDDLVEVVVPTGAAGSATAGCLAKHMGLPIKIVCAVNCNDIVCRTITQGDYSMADEVVPTYATAMDIQVPYNMERIFWMVTGGNTGAVKEVMDQYHETGKAKVPEKICTKIQATLSSFTCVQDCLLSTMKRCFQEDQYSVCPHTAIAVAYYYDKLDSARKEAQNPNLSSASTMPSVCIATASPAKFPEASVAAGVPISTTPEVMALPSLPTHGIPMEKGQDWESMLRQKIEEITARNKCT